MSAVIGNSERTPSFVSTLDAATANERWALESLAAECLPELIAFARSRGSADPDGIAAVVMMEFFSRLPSLEFEAPSQMWAYLYRVARSRIIDERRAAKPVDLLDVESFSDIQAGGVDFDDQVVDRQYVDRLLSSLTSDQREVLEMRFLDDLSIAETATRTGRTASAVKGLQRRAINALSAVLLVALLVGLAVLMFRQTNDSTVISLEPVDNGVDEAVEVPVLEVQGLGEDEIGDPLSIEAVDGERLETSITSGPEASVDTSVARFEFTGTIGESSEVDRFECRLDGDEYFACSSPVELTELDEGGHVFEVRAGSAEGQADATSAVHVWVVDTADEAKPSDDAGAVEADSTAANPSAVSDAAPAPVFKCGPVSGTRREITQLGYDVSIGTEGDDMIDVSGGDRPDFVLAGDGNDSILTGPGDDVVCADGGNDSITSGEGNDRLFGGGGNDTIFSGGGNDRVWSGGGNDTVNGGQGDDKLYGGSGVDSIDGHRGNDKLYGESGFDVLIGGADKDICDEGKDGARIVDTCSPPAEP